MHGKEHRCKHNMIAAYCGLCLKWNDDRKVKQAVDRLVGHIGKIGGGMEAESPKLKAESEPKACKAGVDCLNGPDPQPIENFQKSGIVPSGRLDLCKGCMSKRLKTGHLRKKPKTAPASAPVESGAPARNDSEANMIKLDFTGREELLKTLRERADKEFRTIDAQAFFYIFICVSAKSWIPDRLAE